MFYIVFYNLYMMQARILQGAPVADALYQKTYEYITQHGISGYLAIFMVGENNPSAVYVRKKIAYAEKLWLTWRLFQYDQWAYFDENNTEINELYEKIMHDINVCNTDPQCLWIIIQLPLPEILMQYKKQLLDAVAVEKDVDCLGEKLLTISQVWTGELQVAPATPAATLHLLDYYYCGNAEDNAASNEQLFDLETGKFLKPHVVSVLGESDLIWKPLTHMLKDRGAIVHSFNEFSDQNQMRSICQSSDSIFAATGKLHLVDEQFVRDDQTQIIVDIGRWFIDGKATGDVNFDRITDKIAAYTPVPWWIWPVTVASIFWNMCMLWEWKHRN